MYYQSYEEYMRDVLGYPNTYSNANRLPTYDYYNSYQDMPQMNMYSNSTINNDLEDLYPDIYKVVHPMVRKVCGKNSKPITKNTVDELVMEVYMHLELDENDSVDANVKVQVRYNELRNEVNNLKTKADNETRQHRPTQNRLLQDLIRILVLRELINRPGNILPKPPRPPRPPFPGGRPPMARYNYDYEGGMYY